MEDLGEMVQITNAEQLNRHLALWEKDRVSKKPIGYILSLEGADSIVNIDYLEKSYEQVIKSYRASPLRAWDLCPWHRLLLAEAGD